MIGADGYPEEWHSTIKHATREAANNRCVRCGHPYEKGAGEWSACDKLCTHPGPIRFRFDESVPWAYMSADEYTTGQPLGLLNHHAESGPYEVQARWRILTVHHLDGDKTNCRWWNLAALCQRCHLTIQGKVQMARVWPWEHTEWFRPYVAGFYAFTYLGEDLSREDVMERMDELLALERAA